MQYLPVCVATDGTDSNDTLNQEDELSAMLDKDAVNKKTYTTATFKTTRLINGHDVEGVGKGVLDFRITTALIRCNAGARTFSDWMVRR